MIALSLDSAKNLGVGVAIGLIVLAVASAWLIKTVVTKVIVVLLLGGLALGAWSQRSNLEKCADKAKSQVEAGQSVHVSCKLFGTDVKVP
jgi:high-affinity Fe2+/Pb2+ permease